MNRDPLGVDADRDGHVFNFEFVKWLPCRDLQKQVPGRANGLAYKVGRSANGHEISGCMFLNGFNGNRPPLCLAHHRNKPCLREQSLGELVHTGGCGGTGWADGLARNGVHRPNVIDNPVGQVDWELFTFGSMSQMRLCAASRPVKSLPESKSRCPGFQL